MIYTADPGYVGPDELRVTVPYRAGRVPSERELGAFMPRYLGALTLQFPVLLRVPSLLLALATSVRAIRFPETGSSAQCTLARSVVSSRQSSALTEVVVGNFAEPPEPTSASSMLTSSDKGMSFA